MALSKRTTRRKIVVNFDADGVFSGALQVGERQLIEDGVVLAERLMPPQALTLAEVKTMVAGL